MPNKKIIPTITICILIFALFIVGIVILFFIKYHKITINDLNNKVIEQQKVIDNLTSDNTVLVPGKDLGEFKITFYTHTGNRTSTLVWPQPNRTIAVDPNIIPYGSILYVEGFDFYIAEDCGGDIKNKRLDIFVDTQEEAKKLGVKTRRVYLVGHPGSLSKQ